VRLTINGETVSYTLERERSLGEAVDGVCAWLAASGFTVTGLASDGAELLAQPRESWASRDLAGVGSLEVSAERAADMRLALWRTMEAWLSMLQVELGSPAGAPPPDADPLSDLLAGMSQTLEGLAANPFLPPHAQAGRRFAALWAGLPEEGAAAAAQVRGWPADRLAQAAALVGELRGGLRERIEEAARPAQALARWAAALRGSVDGLRDVSVLLQTGKDKAAMDVLIGFTDAVQSLMQVLPFCAPDPERARLLSELTPVLRELVAAFDARDSVLIGDLLEYEVAPRVERIAPLLERTP
jgi:hypothetical protein